MRFALGVEYDGSGYHGWQKQKGLHTVQNALERALSTIASHPVKVYCAGRTDTGVHATGQVVHFDTDAHRPLKSWVFGTNTHLPRDICVTWAKDVAEDFHARFSAKSRRYLYAIYNKRIRPSLFPTGLAWHYHPLNEKIMHEAAQHLVGEHDFTSFRSVDCQSRTPMRRILYVRVERSGPLVLLNVVANAFLHHMVRNIAGVLMTIGAEKKPSDWILDVLAAKDRSLGCQTAPAYGLYLTHVGYPEKTGLINRVINPLIVPRKEN